MMKRVLCAVMGMACAASVVALEIPLTLTERAGMDRLGNHVNSGIPLPVGQYKNAEGFALHDAGGKPVPAQFVVRERWLKDDSVRFMTVHFVADLKAGKTATFTVKDRGAKASPVSVRVESEGDAIVVDSGAVQFSVNKKGIWHVFDALKSGNAQLSKPGRVIFKAEYGKTPVSGGIATPPEGLPLEDAVPMVQSVQVEEKYPGRVVLLAKGSFEKDGVKKLDFQARYYVLAGSSAVRLAFTVINRQGKAWDEFVGIRSLGVELPFALSGKKTFVLGVSEGDDLTGSLDKGEKIVMLQPNSLEYKVSGKVQAKGACKDKMTKRVGWVGLAGKDTAVTAGVRWFWQLHPKGLAVTGDGVFKIYLVPPQKEKAPVPEGRYTESVTRIDLYTGGARTHELLLTFHKPSVEEARARVLGVTEPLFAACTPEWYCQQTWAFGRIYDANLDNFHPEVRDLIARYEANVDAHFTRVMVRLTGQAYTAAKIKSLFPVDNNVSKDKKVKGAVWCSAQKIEEYGWLNFGSHIEHGSKVKKNDALNSHWDGNYYDFPRACLIRFLRTGQMHYLDAAMEAAYHLADIDIAHWHPTNPKLSGIEHVCPNKGHFRTFWPGKAFRPSGNVHSCKSQSLYELYNITGDAWLRDAGVLSGTYLTNHKGGNVRGMGNRVTGLYCAYRSTRDEKFKKAWMEDVVNRTAAGAIKTGGKKRWDQAWQYGLGCEAMHDYWLVTGDATAAKGIQYATDSLMNYNWGGKRKEYDSLAGFTVAVPGYAYEVTGDIKYLRYGLKRLELTAKSYAGRSKTWAQLSRMSPQFLYYLAKDYTPAKPVVGDKKVADPVKEVFKAPKKKPVKKGVDLGEM